MNKSNTIPHFDGLYGDINSQHNAEFIFSELISTRSQAFGWVIRPHFHSNLYQIFCVESGKVLFKNANKEQNYHEPCLFFIPPGELHGLSYSQDVKGRILTISDLLVENLFIKANGILNFMESIQTISSFKEEYSFEVLKNIILAIDKELFDDKPEKTLMIYSHLTHLFIAISRAISLERIEKNTHPTMQHFMSFKKLIKIADYPKSIAEFAEELKISPIHLNRICKQAVQKSALELVHDHLIQEAQKHLTYTSNSVAEIAYLLKFEYPNYFAKFFKKYTGLSPTEFRENKIRN